MEGKCPSIRRALTGAGFHKSKLFGSYWRTGYPDGRGILVLDAIKPRIIFRAMRPASDGKPEAGRSLSTLGVRPRKDIPLDEEGMVLPSRGGMSVTPDRWQDMPPALLPRSLGGEGRHPLFYLYTSLLPSGLIARIDRPKHANVEPTSRCHFLDFEAEVRATRQHWERQ